MAYLFCNQCGHRNPPGSNFCSSCGCALDSMDNRTITIAKVDPLLDAPGPQDDTIVPLGELPPEAATLIVRSGSQAGERFVLREVLTRLGRHPASEISLDDITVSRRHAEITRDGEQYLVRDVGSLNGTYVNQHRIDEVALTHGDELQVGKFRLVFFNAGERSA
ncbi:MAG: FHA domain-containing protein [Ilumatobacteraceae bacterium]